jgi:hypothetical protein
MEVWNPDAPYRIVEINLNFPALPALIAFRTGKR